MQRFAQSFARFTCLLILGCAQWVASQSAHTLPATLAAPGVPVLTYRAGPTVFGEGVADDEPILGIQPNAIGRVLGLSPNF